jgi:NAD(P)H-dependent flavin oxidoreductase YrpB (nitropropane dioxygenase family)
MNGCSDINLAAAVHQAGALPGLFIDFTDRYNKDGSLNIDCVHDNLTEFQRLTGSHNLVVHATESDLLNYKFLKLLKDHQVPFIEIFSYNIDPNIYSDPKFYSALRIAKKTTKIFSRINSTSTDKYPDVFCIKGSESGGFTGRSLVSELFDRQMKTHSTPCIPYGGIGTPKQVADYIQRGAIGVAAGTIFAASCESCLTESVKETMCKTSSSNLTKFSDTQQQVLIFDKNLDLEHSDNNTRHHSLKTGIHSDATKGHIYAGQAIEHITEILPVKDIVEYLVSDL